MESYRSEMLFVNMNSFLRFFVYFALFLQAFCTETDARRGSNNAPSVSFVTMSSGNELRISDNPTLVVNEKQPVSLICQFAMAKGAILREIVWYREFDDGTNVKLLTYDAIMNITQVNDLASKNIKGRGPTTLQIDSTSPTDDGWYQCHVGIYINRKILEKVGYIYLNVLVPPSKVRIAVHNSIDGNSLFRHNFSLVCRVEQSKPAANLVFTRNGKEIKEINHVNSTTLLGGMAESYADLLLTKDVSSDVKASITSGNLEIKDQETQVKSIIRYTVLHLKAQISGTKMWESSSYLLWTLYPQYDTDSEYGCLAKHESLEKAKYALQTLIMFPAGPPTEESLQIEVKPNQPSLGSNVILQLNPDLLQNIFPKPILLWTNDLGHMKNKQKFYVGNKLLLRNVRRNNTIYKVQAFNALGTASTKTILVLSDKGESKNNNAGHSGSIASILRQDLHYQNRICLLVTIFVQFLQIVVCNDMW
uniref:Immunoglobulin superfamily member 21-like n=1 Tax=Phallusia mammillata TaxID=59560 RepID=A0A6F9DFY2_9ASCI|nr:immunoglobulin superfamily member 21-like [Phallusia mammillata]